MKKKPIAAKDLYGHDVSICIIGAGGNGSHFIKNLVPMLLYLKQTTNNTYKVSVWDNDNIAPHNIGRQSFNPASVGQNKAVNICSRVNLTYGLNFRAFPFLYEFNMNKEGMGHDIYVLAVDDAHFRYKFYDYHKGIKPYVIDMGNGDSFGQVYQFFAKDLYNDSLAKEYFKALKNAPSKLLSESCSSVESVKTQGLYVNTFMATIAVSMLFNFIYYKYSKQPFVSYFNSITSEVRTVSFDVSFKSNF